jgi:hypothetical protein
VGQQVTFTARLSGLYGGTPTGSVTFKQGTTVLTTVGIVNGQASFTYTFSKSGKFVITAAYSGDSNFNAASKTIAQVVQKHTTTTSLTASPSPVNYAKTVTLTAGVATTGPTAPTGTVTFRNGTSIVGTSTLPSGKEVLQTAKLPVGSNTLTATYNGDALNAKSTSPALVEVVKQAKISMKLASSPNPSALGQSVKFTATLTSNGGLPVGGMVTFSFGSTTLGTATVGSTGLAVFSSTALPHGSDVIKATYAGNANYSAATASVTQTVN